MRMFRGRFQRNFPTAAVTWRKRATTAVALGTRCPLLCCTGRTFGGTPRRAASQPVQRRFQCSVVVRQQLVPAGGGGRRQRPHHNSESRTVLAQRGSTRFSQSPLNEVPDYSVPYTLGNNEPNPAGFVGSNGCRI